MRRKPLGFVVREVVEDKEEVTNGRGLIGRGGESRSGGFGFASKEKEALSSPLVLSMRKIRNEEGCGPGPTDSVALGLPLLVSGPTRPITRSLWWKIILTSRLVEVYTSLIVKLNC